MRIAFLNWRDTSNPEGGGSEVYIEQIARRLAGHGHQVTLVCAQHRGAAPVEWRDGVRIVRRGSKLSVYSEARKLLRQGSLGPIDVVVDTQNGIPFLAPWATTAPVVVLVHHIHREQWPVVYDPLRARIGWWVESRVAPFVYRDCRYVAVSTATRDELQKLGVAGERISVIRNGATAVDFDGDTAAGRDPQPRILVLGRLVPHKRVEHVLRAAARLRSTYPGLSVAVVGDGWWAEALREQARQLAVDDIVEFTGHVSEERKASELARAWVLALPSLKEGWGLVVLEAGSHGVPAVAYREAGGVSESIVEGATGLLVDGSEEDYTSALERVLADAALRTALGRQAQEYAAQFSWDASAEEFEKVLTEAVSYSTRTRRTGRRRWGAPRSGTR